MTQSSYHNNNFNCPSLSLRSSVNIHKTRIGICPHMVQSLMAGEAPHPLRGKAEQVTSEHGAAVHLGWDKEGVDQVQG